MTRVRSVGVVGFEPAIQSSLESLLGGEPGYSVMRFPANWCPSTNGVASLEGSPDILIIAPPSRDWVDHLHAQFPQALLLAMVDWHREDQFVGAPIAGYFERYHSYSNLLELLNLWGSPEK